jgi:competence protein ComEC
MNAVSHRPSFEQYPLALLATAFAGGILLARRADASLPIIIQINVCAASLLVLWLWRAAHRRDESVRRRWTTVFVLCAFACCGAAAFQIQKSSVAPNRVRQLFETGKIASGDPVEITGALERAPEIAPDGFYFTVRVESLTYKNADAQASGAVQYFAPMYDEAERALFDSLDLRRGARVRVMARVRREDEFRNPGVASFIERLDARGIDATATLKSALLIERLTDAPLAFYELPLVWLDAWRASLIARIDRFFNAETAGVLKAVLLGNRYGISRAVAENYRAGGTFHLLVIAGLHISFIGGIAYWMTRRLTRRRSWQFIASTVFLWTYALMVGLDEPITRAALMFTFVALAPVLARRSKPLNALGAATLILLIARPNELFDPSFQLTVVSVLSIVCIAAPALEKMQAIGAWRLSRAAPAPPRASRWFVAFCEILFWSERDWRREIERAVYDYKLFKTPLAAKLERLRAQRILRYIFAAIIVSMSVQIGILPLMIVYFHRVSLAGVALNTFACALMAFSTLAAVITIALSFINASAATFFAHIVERSVWLTTHSIDVFKPFHLAQIRLPHYTGKFALIYFLYYLPLALLCLALALWQPLRVRDEIVSFLKPKFLISALTAFAILFALILAHPFSAPRPDGRLHIDFLDVGQGDAALLTMPDGTTLLVDAGGRCSFGKSESGANGFEKAATEDWESDFDHEPPASFERDGRSIGEAVVSEFLWQRGLDRVDYILATHAHDDHIDGLNDVARNFRVRAALVARAPTGDAAFQKFARTVKDERVPIEFVARGDEMYFGDVKIRILAPPRVASVNAPSGNNDSIVLLVQFGARRFLLMGDAERGEENLILSEAINANDEDAAANEHAARAASTFLRADVVKVGHHGSRTSSTAPLVEAAHPQFAIISVGRHSIFGHPHREVMERWRAAGAQVLTTGESGTISFSTDGKDLKLETFAH